MSGRLVLPAHVRAEADRVAAEEAKKPKLIAEQKTPVPTGAILPLHLLVRNITQDLVASVHEHVPDKNVQKKILGSFQAKMTRRLQNAEPEGKGHKQMDSQVSGSQETQG